MAEIFTRGRMSHFSTGVSHCITQNHGVYRCLPEGLGHSLGSTWQTGTQERWASGRSMWPY